MAGRMIQRFFVRDCNLERRFRGILLKILSVILMVLVCVTTMVSAVHDSTVVGPYNISFDLGIPKDSYKVIISDPRQEESLNGDISTVYLIVIRTESIPSNTCMIHLSESDSALQKASQESLGRAARDILSNEFQASNLEVAPRTIDGSDGAVAAGYLAGDKIYNSIYNVNIGPVPRHLVCKIFSDYPWEEGTLSLLKTIHVEKVNFAS